MENPWKEMEDDCGYPYFRKPPYMFKTQETAPQSFLLTTDDWPHWFPKNRPFWKCKLDHWSRHWSEDKLADVSPAETKVGVEPTELWPTKMDRKKRGGLSVIVHQEQESFPNTKWFATSRGWDSLMTFWDALMLVQASLSTRMNRTLDKLLPRPSKHTLNDVLPHNVRLMFTFLKGICRV